MQTPFGIPGSILGMGPANALSRLHHVPAGAYVIVQVKWSPVLSVPVLGHWLRVVRAEAEAHSLADSLL